MLRRLVRAPSQCRGSSSFGQRQKKTSFSFQPNRNHAVPLQGIKRTEEKLLQSQSDQNGQSTPFASREIDASNMQQTRVVMNRYFERIRLEPGGAKRIDTFPSLKGVKHQAISHHKQQKPSPGWGSTQKHYPAPVEEKSGYLRQTLFQRDGTLADRLKGPSSVQSNSATNSDAPPDQFRPGSFDALRQVLKPRLGNSKIETLSPLRTIHSTPPPHQNMAARISPTLPFNTNDSGRPLIDYIQNVREKLQRDQDLNERAVESIRKDSHRDQPLWRKNLSSETMQRNRTETIQRGPPIRQMEVEDLSMKNRSKKKRQSYSDPKDLSVKIPSYPVPVKQASILLREKKQKLISMLKALGEIPRDTNENSDFMVSPETIELVAIELNREMERQEGRAVQNDDQILMQRRSAMGMQERMEEADEESGTTLSQKVVKPRAELLPRPPVVTIMGHVDHGKTTLMDALRRRSQNSTKSSKKNKKVKKKAKSAVPGNVRGDVAGTEAGGITQVITAFQVDLAGADRNTVTFLDTPGHAAFSAMRQRGTDAADIIVLVIAADDGVSPQTIEIIDFYKSIVQESDENGITMVVALNKIDIPELDIDEARTRIENQLIQHNLVPEGTKSLLGCVGAPVQIFPVSGLTGEGLDDLIEGLVLQAEVMDLRADHESKAEGLVMDARVDKGLGIIADCVVRWGSIRKGDIVVSGTCTGKVKLLKSTNGMALDVGLPSQPLRIVGFETVPNAGDPVMVVESEQAADELIERRRVQDAKVAQRSAVTSSTEIQSERNFTKYQGWQDKLRDKYGLDAGENDDTPVHIPVIIKADADGTLVAVKDAMVKLGEDSPHNVVIDCVEFGVGPILGTELHFATNMGATIICFNVKNDRLTEMAAEAVDVPIITSNIIYSLIDEVKKEFGKYLPLKPVDLIHGKGKVKEIFKIGGVNSKVAGLRVMDGKMYKASAKATKGKLPTHFRVIRKGKVVSPEEGYSATSLKHFKEEVDHVDSGKDCGLALDGCSDLKEGDEIECYSIEMQPQTF
jgi:small GTP-binding protein